MLYGRFYPYSIKHYFGVRYLATADGKANVTLFARDGSVWMNPNQLAELFDTSVPNISMHISNILNDKELEANSVVKNYLTTADKISKASP